MRTLALLGAAILLAATPAAAQSAAEPSAAAAPAAAPATAPAPTRWEHLAYIHVEATCRVATAKRGGTVAGKCLDVMRKLGATDGELPPRDASSAEYDAAALDLLGRRGWELVSCETREVATSLLGGRGDQLTCWLRRPVTAPEAPGDP